MLSSSPLSSALATDRERAARETARTAWERHPRGEVVIRPAAEADAAALVHLARLDSSRPPAGTVLVAEDAGEIVAALSVEDGAGIANPFRRTAPIVAMLRLRAEQTGGADPRRERRGLRALRRLRASSATA